MYRLTRYIRRRSRDENPSVNARTTKLAAKQFYIRKALSKSESERANATALESLPCDLRAVIVSDTKITEEFLVQVKRRSGEAIVSYAKGDFVDEFMRRCAAESVAVARDVLRRDG